MGIRGRLVVFGYPLAEVLAFWGVATVIGWGWAFLGLLLGIPVGLALIRNAGASAAGLMQANVAGDARRAGEMTSSMAGQFVAGVLIAVPGYLTDLLGLALLLPGVRRAIGRLVMRRYASSPWMARMPGSGPIIQGTVIVEDLRYANPPDGGEEPPAITR